VNFGGGYPTIHLFHKLEKFSCKGKVVVVDKCFLPLVKGITVKIIHSCKCNKYSYLSAVKKCKMLSGFKFPALWPVFSTFINATTPIPRSA
jgi:hypothetical protein